MAIDPSFCWKFSRIAMSVRPTARPEPLSVCRNSALPAPLTRYFRVARRAWKASVLLQEEISRYVFWLGSHTSMS